MEKASQNEGALCAVGAEESVVPLSELKELQAKVRELERLLGRKTMEVEILEDAIRIARVSSISPASSK